MFYTERIFLTLFRTFLDIVSGRKKPAEKQQVFLHADATKESPKMCDTRGVIDRVPSISPACTRGRHFVLCIQTRLYRLQNHRPVAI